MTLKSILRLSAALLMTTTLVACFDVDQKVSVDKGEMNYQAEIRVDAKLAALTDKKDGLCGNLSQGGSPAIKLEISEAVAGGNVVCTLSARGPIDQFANFASGDQDNSLLKVSRAADGAWRIDSSFDLKDKAGANPMMEGMMQAMLAGRNLSWTVSVPKVLETNGQLSQDGKTVSWTAPLASAYKAKQSFYVVFKAERPWYAFLLDLIDAIKKFFASLFGGTQKAAAPAAPPPATPATPPPTAPTVAPTPVTQTPAAGPVEAPTAAAAAPVEAGPITASFDCAKASSAQEKMICSDRDLARLDVDLSAAYRKARDAAADAKALQSEQLQWLKSTRSACSDKACLVEAYKSRLVQLSR
jgi:uncharacterized protein YecT (DUF1311 family)